MLFINSRLLQEKKEDIQSSEMKLKNGLWKIDDTKSKVEAMTIELVDAKRNVEKFQKQCEEYLASIVQQKREADEQAKVGILSSWILLSTLH